MRMKDVCSVLICKGNVWLTLLPTMVPVNICPSSLPKSGSKLPMEQLAQGQASGPALEPEIIAAALPAAPFAIGPHQRVVEHKTYAICLDYERHVGVHTGRKCFNDHALKGNASETGRVKFFPWYYGDKDDVVHNASSAGGRSPPGRHW
eukprot:4358901-Amphidinium_carterae.1